MEIKYFGREATIGSLYEMHEALGLDFPINDGEVSDVTCSKMGEDE